MAKEALLKIQEAEAKAQAIIADARAQADCIIKNNEEELSQEFSQLSGQVKNQALAEKEAAEKNSLRISEEFDKKTQELCNTLTGEMEAKKCEAVNLLLGMIAD